MVQAGESDAVADLDAGDSVTGFDASDLEALGAQSIEDLAGFTPNLEIVTSGATTPTFFIRGVGLNDFNANSTGAVAIYTDDVVKNSPALQLATLFDMEAVNVLRGPQGTGPARNASAGAIKLYSRKPSGEFGGYIRADYGNFDHLDYEGAVEMPVYEDILSTRFSFRYSQRDGYATNRCGGAPPMSIRKNRGTLAQDLADDGMVTGPTDPSVSICGERVERPNPFLGTDGFSPIPEGLPRKVNNRNNWAARGVMRFQPTLDTDFLLIGHGARRDEYSRLGQSYGTNVTPSIPGCTPAGSPQCRVRGSLGGPDSQEYVPIEVKQLLDNIVASGMSRNDGRFAVAEKLARNLDSKPHSGDFNRVGSTNNDVYGVSLKGDVSFGDTMTFTTVTGYDVYDRTADTDLDQSPNTLFEIDSEDNGWQIVQDLALTGALPGSELPFTWTLGAFGIAERIEANIENRFPPNTQGLPDITTGREYTQDLFNVAGYASFAWDFWDDFTLDGGARYQWENRQMDLDRFQGRPAPDRTTTRYTQDKIFQDPTGTLRLTYRFREDTHAYWKFSRGWKSGHFNATTGDQGITVADPETINAFEAGLRGSWFTGRLNLNASVFHYEYDNYQIFTVEIPLNGAAEFVVINASDAVVYGAELDGVFRPLPGMFLQARFSWLESEFIDFVQRQASQQQVGTNSVVFVQEVDNSGNRLLNSPQFKVSLTAEQTFPLGRFGSLTARWDGAWTDDTYYDATEGRGFPNFQGDQFLPENTIGQKAYWLHNVRVGYRTPDGSIELAGWVRNLTDQVYKTFAFDASALPANKTTVYAVGEPRTYGMTLTAFF
ncbi:MAG: TonB-dependent receptor [Myxococcota bacterium]